MKSRRHKNVPSLQFNFLKRHKDIFSLNYFSFLNWYLVLKYHNDVLKFLFILSDTREWLFKFLKNELISFNLMSCKSLSIIFSQEC